MSSENGSDTSNSDVLDKVCRDFLRNVCRRGKRCKFVHPNETEQESLTNNVVETGKTEYVFCHDYQNTQCVRPNCRFIHCTREEEHFFKLTGELPEHILQESIRKGITFESANPGDPPVCKDYLKGTCRRAGKCKFRHLSLREYEIELGFHIATLPPWQSTGAGAVIVARRRALEDTVFTNAGIGLDAELCPPRAFLPIPQVFIQYLLNCGSAKPQEPEERVHE